MPRAIRFPGVLFSLNIVLPALVAVGVTAISLTPANAITKKRAMIVLDMSRSMSGSLGPSVAPVFSNPVNDDNPLSSMAAPIKTGKRTIKSGHVKKTLGKAYRDFSQKLNMGIVAFGHRSPNSCTDIETVKNLGAINPSAYASVTNALKPIGASPVSSAILHAAEAANYKNTINSVILITDSIDSCGFNPCKLGGDLRNSGANITVHVVAIGLPKSQQANLRCLAGHTRGHFFTVSSRQQLTKAIYQSFNGAAITGHLPPEPAPSSNIIADAKKSPATQGTDTVPVPRRKPARAAATTAEATGKPEAKTKAADKPVVSNGKAASAAMAAKTVVKNGKSNTTAAKTMPSAPNSIVKTSPEMPDSIKALTSSAPGTIRVAASILKGAPPLSSGVKWNVYNSRGGEPGKKITSSNDSAPSFTLPAGEYIFEASLGYADARSTINLQSEKELRETLNLNAGGLRLSSVIGGNQKIPADDVEYIVRTANGAKTISRHIQGDKLVHLNAGSYHVTSRYGRVNAEVEANISVQPGKLTDATLNHNAGKISFRLVKESGGEQLSDVKWQVKKANGDTVASSVVSAPSYVLAAGAYKIIAKQSGKVYRSSFVIRAGDIKTKEIISK